MLGRMGCLAVAVLSAAASLAGGQPPGDGTVPFAIPVGATLAPPVALPAGQAPPPVNQPPSPEPATQKDDSFSRFLLQDPFSSINGKEDNGKEAGEGRKEGPPHIRDNAFLVEEASNQEAGVVQHIFNWITFWDRTPEGRTRDFAMVYTMELPLGSQTHQFSFATQFLTAFEHPVGGPASQQGDVGDTFLNYRYQLLADDDFLWCSPRFTLILPTGDERFGLGTGRVGYQFNLPVSRYGENFDFHFNAGTTYTPDVSVLLDEGLFSPGHDLRAYNLGASVFWKPKTYLHFFVEALAVWADEISDEGARERTTQVFVNPGVRYAVCQFEDVEWVLGVSVPVGLTRDSPDIGVFAYMSVEHTFRKR